MLVNIDLKKHCMYYINLYSAHDMISHHAVVLMQWSGLLLRSLNICKLCFKFLR